MGKHTTQYIRIFDYMISEYNLTGNDLIVYAFIHGFTQQSKKCYATQTGISKLMNIDRSTVLRCLNRLSTANMVQITHNDDRIEYRALQTRTDGNYFDIFKNMFFNLKANQVLVLAYIKKNMKATLTQVSEALRISLNTVSRITSKLNELHYFIKARTRNALGRFSSVQCRNANYYTKCNTITQNDASNTPECATKNKNYIKNDNKSKPTYKNSFNNFQQNDYDFDALERDLVCNYV